MLKLDLIDRKILYELDINARIPLTQLAKKLKIGREKANYRLNNLIKKGIIRKFVTMANPAKFGYCVYKLFLKFQNTTLEIETEIFNWMVKNDFIYWVANCKGKWDANLTIFARNINHFEEIMSDFFTKYGEYLAEQEFNTTLEVGILSKDWILPENKLIGKIALFGGDYKDIGLDKFELELLKFMANNGRMSAPEIAKKINSTSRMVLYHMKELEKKRVILGYTTSLNLEILNKQFFKSVIYFKNFNQSIKKRVIEFCRMNPCVGFYIFCVGSWPVELELIVDSNKQFYEVMDDFRKYFPEMKNYEFMIFPKEYKFDWVPQCYKPEK